jgi:crotonobetainyl-CoA:carnitine CoA-transferase CaiB-like acyl-CoA transferase
MFGDGTTPEIDSSFAVDKAVAAMVCQAALAAIFERERTGSARRVDLAMYDAAAYFNFPDFMVNRTFLRHEPPSAKNMHPSAVRPLRTSDGWIVTIAGTREQTRRSLEVIGRADVYTELMKIPDGVEITRRLYAEMAEVLVTDTTEHWLAAFAAKDLATAPCLTIDEHLAAEQTANNGLYSVVDWHGEPDYGPMRQVRYPAVFEGHPHLHPTSGAPPLHDVAEPGG